MNQLNDISLDYNYATLCGITHQELTANLRPELEQLGQMQSLTWEETVEMMVKQYDGYHFHPNREGVFNPFSTLSALDKREFGDYWFQTGTPTFLVELLKKHHYDLHRMAHEETTAEVLNSIDSTSDNPIPVIYQSGYLTIKGYDPEFGNYRLGFPNREVEQGFIKFLLPFYANTNAVES